MKVGDLIKIKRGYAWKYESNREWARSQSPLLVLNAGADTIKVCNVENLWVPHKYFEVISAAR